MVFTVSKCKWPVFNGEWLSILLVLTEYLATNLFNTDFYSTRDWFYFLDLSIFKCRHQKDQNDSNSPIFGRRRWFNALFWCDSINVKSMLGKVWIKRFVTAFLSHSSAFYLRKKYVPTKWGTLPAQSTCFKQYNVVEVLTKSQASGWWKLVVLQTSSRLRRWTGLKRARVLARLSSSKIECIIQAKGVKANLISGWGRMK